MKKLALLFAMLLVPVALAQRDDGSSKVAGPSYDGQEVTVDLPPSQQFRNIGSKVDGAGMCVFTSIEMAARAQGLEEMRGYRDWWASVSAGGGWPQQVDKSLKAWWAYKKIEPIPYYQYEGPNPEEVLSLCDKTGRMACLTYGWSPRYVQPGWRSGRGTDDLRSQLVCHCHAMQRCTSLTMTATGITGTAQASLGIGRSPAPWQLSQSIVLT